jgi:NOL1/NOP2/fmu family ribosome biogenesis protein
MVQSLKIQNSKEIKHIYELLEKQFGCAEKLDVAFLLSEKKERLYIFTKDLANVDTSRLRIDTMGLYFGTFFDGMLRLTIEGTQLLGPHCTKHIIDVTKQEMQSWMQGEKLELSKLTLPQEPVEPGAFVIIRYKHPQGSSIDYLGCGKIGGDLILNYIPKTRYIHALYHDQQEQSVDSHENVQIPSIESSRG